MSMGEQLLNMAISIIVYKLREMKVIIGKCIKRITVLMLIFTRRNRRKKRKKKKGRQTRGMFRLYFESSSYITKVMKVIAKYKIY